jgi:hypothetical protein
MRMSIQKLGFCTCKLKLDHHFNFIGSNGSNHSGLSLKLSSINVTS